MQKSPAEGKSAKVSRRRFLKGGAVAAGAAAGTIAMPQISRAQTISWRFQSTWPARDIFHEMAADYVRIVNEMSGGRLNLELLPAGAVVGALQMQDAVIAGALDGGHGVTAYWYGKHKAYSLFGTPPAFGWDAHQMLAWIRYGGGQELYDELVQSILGLDLVGFFVMPMPTQPLGWFRQEISSAADLRDLKYRTVGLAADLFNQLGAAVTIMGGPDIVPALDRGLLDAAEFNNPGSDRALGFNDVSKNWFLRSYHQDAECFEIIFNKSKYEELPGELQAILKWGADAASTDNYYKAMKRYPDDFEWLETEGGVTMHITPDDILEAQLAAWDRVIEASTADPNTGEFFGRVIESQKAFCQKTVGWYLKNQALKEPAYKHFFGA